MVDIVAIVCRMRDQRMKMVQTPVSLRLQELILWTCDNYLCLSTGAVCFHPRCRFGVSCVWRYTDPFI